jgi:hypothetical protein
MRDVKRIDVMLDRIREIWTKCPDLRFMQLIVNCIGNELPYRLEDDELLRMINKTYPRGKKKITRGFKPSILAPLNPADRSAIAALLGLISCGFEPSCIEDLDPAGGDTNSVFEFDPSNPADRSAIAALLGLISVCVSDEDIADWPKEMAAEVMIWTIAKLSEANGYTVKIPTRPAVLPQPP